MRLIAANAAFADCFLLDLDALAGRSLADLVDAEGLRLLQDLLAGRALTPAKAVRLKFGGQELAALLPRHCQSVAAGRLVLFAPKAVGEDERSLLALFREALDGVMHYVAIFDSEDRLIACNKYYKDTFSVGDQRLPPEIKLEGKTYRELMELRVRYKSHIELVEDPEGFVEDRVRRFHSDSDSRVRMATGRMTRVQYRPLRDGGRVLISTDITEVVEAEAKQRELQAQLHHSQRLEALGTLAGGLAHDLNNVLVPILALTQMTARRLPQGSQEQRNLETVLKSVERAKDLVARILTFSRKGTLGVSEFNLGAVIPEGLEMLRALIPTTIDIRTELQPVPAMRGDPGQWHQVLMNLLTNAAHAIGFHRGRITVELGPHEKGGIRFAVRDTGAGMDEETRRRALEPFFTTRKVGEGTGLGLSVVHGIVTAHGGAIEIETAPGQGTCFSIILPVRGANGELSRAEAATV